MFLHRIRKPFQEATDDFLQGCASGFIAGRGRARTWLPRRAGSSAPGRCALGEVDAPGSRVPLGRDPSGIIEDPWIVSRGVPRW